MTKIFKNMAPYWSSIILIVLLLIMQAYCDLALPQYTSQIIDTGIQNKGVSHVLPEKMKKEDYELSTIYMTDEEKDLWNNQYEEKGNFYVRKELTGEELEAMDDQLLIPLVMIYRAGNMSDSEFRAVLKQQIPQLGDKVDTLSLQDIKKTLKLDINIFTAEDENGKQAEYVDMRSMLKEMKEKGILTEQVISASREQMEKMIDATGSKTLESMGIAYAIACDKEAGVDVDQAQMTYMWSEGGRMLLMALVMLVVSVLVCFLAARIGAGIGRDLREGLFTKVVRFSNREMDQFSTASLITRNTNDVQQIQMVSTMILRMILYAPIIGIGGVIKVIQTGAHMGWVIVLAVLVVVGLVLVLVSIAMPKFKAMQKLVDGVNLVSREILTGLPVIRAFGREKTEEDRFDKANRELTKTQLFTNRVMTFMMPGMMLVMYGVTLLIVWVASHRIDAGTMQVGAMTAFISYSMQIIMAFLMLTMMSIMLPRAGVAAERIDEVMRTPLTVLDPEGKEGDPKAKKEETGKLVFDHVSFCYPNAEENVLSDINFTAETGKTTAIIGSTGCGKTTLVNLIPRFYDVTEGSIRLNGVDIRDLKKEDLRKQIGYVPQKGILFSGTIASNLRFGDFEAKEEELKKAAEIAQAMEFIEEKEDELEAHIAQGGTNVSGGQKQRLSIARAIVKKPEVYIFDDSFSALDMKTDAALRKALEPQLESAALIIVAQRISTILHADQILVLDEGNIVGIGTHDELLDSCEVYQQIAYSQLSEKELGRNSGKEEQ